MPDTPLQLRCLPLTGVMTFLVATVVLFFEGPLARAEPLCLTCRWRRLSVGTVFLTKMRTCDYPPAMFLLFLATDTDSDLTASLSMSITNRESHLRWLLTS